MKLITIATLLIADFDVIFTCLSIFAYHQAGGIFYFFNATLLMFLIVYIGGCYFAAKEANHFLERFKEKVQPKRQLNSK